MSSSCASSTRTISCDPPDQITSAKLWDFAAAERRLLASQIATEEPEPIAVDDALYGTRDKRGDWKPSKLIQYPPVFVWPAQPMKFVKWLFGYPGFILPWNLLYAAVGVL